MCPETQEHLDYVKIGVFYTQRCQTKCLDTQEHLDSVEIGVLYTQRCQTKCPDTHRNTWTPLRSESFNRKDVKLSVQTHTGTPGLRWDRTLVYAKMSNQVSRDTGILGLCRDRSLVKVGFIMTYLRLMVSSFCWSPQGSGDQQKLRVSPL